MSIEIRHISIREKISDTTSRTPYIDQTILIYVLYDAPKLCARIPSHTTPQTHTSSPAITYGSSTGNW